MSVNDRDDRSSESSKETGQSDMRHSDPPPAQRRARRRLFTRLNALIGAIAIVAGVLLLVLIFAFVYRLGYLDRYVASQIKDTFTKYGIRAEIKNFHATLPPQTVE